MSNTDHLAGHLAFFGELGVDGVSRDPRWRVRGSNPLAASGPTETATAADALERVRAQLGDCTRCKLHASRTHLVYGVGNPEADLMS